MCRVIFKNSVLSFILFSKKSQQPSETMTAKLIKE